MKNEKSLNDKSTKIGVKKFTYSEIVSVGRTLRRFDNLLNNLEQFKEAYEMSLGLSDQEVEAFKVLEKSVVYKSAYYRCLYDRMTSSIF